MVTMSASRDRKPSESYFIVFINRQPIYILCPRTSRGTHEILILATCLWSWRTPSSNTYTRSIGAPLDLTVDVNNALVTGYKMNWYSDSVSLYNTFSLKGCILAQSHFICIFSYIRTNSVLTDMMVQHFLSKHMTRDFEPGNVFLPIS